MIMPIVIALLAVVLMEGAGHCLLKILHIKRTIGFTAPIGTAVVYAILELLYLPRLCLGGPFDWIKGASMVVFIACVAVFIGNLKDTFHSLCRGRIVYVLLACSIMFGLFYLCSAYLSIGNDSELLLMAKNVDSQSIMLENNRLQGYEMLGAIVTWGFSGNLEKVALTLALFATMISVMLSLDIIDSFDIGNPWFRFTLIVFSVFYAQFYSWKISGAFHGGNWRILFITLALFVLYEWLKTGIENLKYLFPIVIFAGMFSHNGFLMIGFELVYLSAVYLFRIKKIRSLYDVLTFLIPIIIYVIAWVSKYSKGLAVVFSIVALVCYLCRMKRSVYVRLIRVEDFMIDHSWNLFFLAIPFIFLVGSFILRYFTVRYSIPYSEYIHFFSSRSIGTYLFMSHSILDVVLDICRWTGMLVFLFRANKSEERCMRLIFCGMVVFFINPLCMGMLTQITGLDMYAHAFEIIFNPFTDIMIFYWIYRQFEWTVIGQWVLELILVITCVLGHISSFTNNPSGLYTDLLARDATSGKVILP